MAPLDDSGYEDAYEEFLDQFYGIKEIRHRQCVMMGDILDRGLLEFTSEKIKKIDTKRLKYVMEVYGEIRNHYLKYYQKYGSTPNVEKIISRTGSLLRKIDDELKLRKGIFTKKEAFAKILDKLKIYFS